MYESLGAGLALREAGAIWGIVNPSTTVGVEESEPIVYFSNPQETGRGVSLAIRDIEPIIEYLQSDEHLTPPELRSVEVERQFPEDDTLCTACQHDSAPEEGCLYLFTQECQTRVSAVLHEECTPRFVEALENVWNHSDCLLAGEL